MAAMSDGVESSTSMLEVFSEWHSGDPPPFGKTLVSTKWEQTAKDIDLAG